LGRQTPRRTKFLKARVTPDERGRFASLCAEQGVTAAEGMRRLAREAANFGPTLEPPARDEVIKLAGEMRAAGVNLNQIVRAMNTGLAPDIKLIRDQIAAVGEQLAFYEALLRGICAPRRKRLLAAIGNAGDAL
jgi:mobilization protein MobC